MKKLLNNPFDNPDKSGRVVPRIVAQAAVFILLFAATLSCEKTDNPFEYEITEVFTSRFSIRIHHATDRFLMFDQLSSGLAVEPINLPEEFQRNVHVQATVGRIGEKTNEHGHPLVKITQIQETDLRSNTFTVETNSRGEFFLLNICLGPDGMVLLGCPCNPRLIPINLPEEFQWGYPYNNMRFVVVTYRHTGERNLDGHSFVEIVEIHEFLRKGRLCVRKSDRWGYILANCDGPYHSPYHSGFLIPTNLPKEFQVEGLYVQIMYIALGDGDEGGWIIEVREIYEVGSTPARTRITGGDETHIRYHPWQVHFSRRGERGCGGIIIAPNLILTAYHCLEPIDGQPITERCLRVYAGITCRTEINNSNTFEVSRIIPHPDLHTDIMLLQLSRPIPFNNYRHPINFMASANSSLFGIGSRVTMTGWGGTVVGLRRECNVKANCLQTVDLTVINTTVSPPHLITARGTGNTRQGGCHGDSGGPLIIRTASGEPVLIGVTRAIRTAGCGGTNESNPTFF